MFRIYLCSLICLLYVENALSQNFVFSRIKIEDGLPHSTINDLVQDSLGFIWLATNDGLARYDNNEFKVFNHSYKNGSGIANSQVRTTFVDSRNQLWVGTSNSIEMHEPFKNNFKSYSIINRNDNYRVPVSDFFENSDSTFLLGTDGGGLIRFNKRTGQSDLALDEEVNNNFGQRVTSICKDKFNRYWITTSDSGWFVLNQSLSKIIYNCKTNTLIKKIPEYSKVIQIDNERMLIASYGSGVFEVNVRDFATKEFKYFQNSNVQTLQVFDIYISGDMLFVGTDGDGLHVVDLYTNSMKHYLHNGYNPSSIGGNVIRDIFIDKENNVWLAHFQAGLSVSKKKKEFNNIPFIPNDSTALCHPNVASILIDDTLLWVGTDGGGINIIDKNRVYSSANGALKKIVKYESVPPQKILCIQKDSRGLVWIGTYLEGAFVYNSTTKELLNVEDCLGVKLSNQDVRCIYEDLNGHIWLGTHGGGVNIIDMEKKSVKYLQRDTSDYSNTLTLDWVEYLYGDSYGFIWIATSYGLNMYDPVRKEIKQYFNNEEDVSSLSNSFINIVFEDNKKNIWVGTREGLNKFNRSTNNFTRYNVENGLTDDIITAICQDENSNLWISTNNGLSKMTPGGRFVNYDVNDGLISNSFVGGACATDKSGCIFWGTINGLMSFNPATIIDDYSPIKVVFTNLQIQNKKILPGQEVNGRKVLENQLPYTKRIELFKEENVLTFNFSALTFAYHDKVDFLYKLDGFDNEWIVLEKGNSVTYTNLKKGEYTLKVRVGNMGRNQPVSSLKVIILPPYYETWWFRIVISLFVIIVVALIIKSRIDKIKHEKILLQEKYEVNKIKAEQDKITMEKLRLENEVKQKELDMGLKNSQLISTTLLITTKNEIMKQVKADIHSFSKSIISDEVKVGVDKLLEKINTGFKVEDDWVRFEEHFDQVHIDYFKRVKEKFPHLSLTYLKLIAYLRLDLSTKEIAALMSISTRGVEKSRSRLRKKLGLEPGENLSKIIAQI